jgi:hypothetical protein
MRAHWTGGLYSIHSTFQAGPYCFWRLEKDGSGYWRSSHCCEWSARLDGVAGERRLDRGRRHHQRHIPLGDSWKSTQGAICTSYTLLKQVFGVMIDGVPSAIRCGGLCEIFFSAPRLSAIKTPSFQVIPRQCFGSPLTAKSCVDSSPRAVSFDTNLSIQ